ncbi:hypothetical protein AB0I55_24695 [Actinocatenispora sera]|uniref:SMODS domain-containing nucleotidyltransferase n=1 Tax=Actinocatenispora sera TaxID=390989 RepID=UPI0034084F4A
METADSWLRFITQLYTPNPAEFDAARSHRNSIEARLDAYIGLHEMFEIGSLKHGTGVWNYSDADFLVSLTGTRPSSIWTMLNKVKEALQGRFQTTPIVVRRPAVVCQFSDADVEIVPAYPVASGSGYYIADPSDGWMTTYPKEHNQYVTTINSRHDGNVKRLVRQLKTWKYKRSVPVSSCYLEMRATKYMAGENTYAPLWDLYASLNRLFESGLAAMNDPTGLSSRFGACSSEANRQDALSKLNTAVIRARKASDFAYDGDHPSSIEQLKLLFNY